MGFSDISRRFEASPSTPAQKVDKASLLASGEWIDERTARFHDISDDERLAAWLARDTSDWHVPHDDLTRTHFVYRDYAVHSHVNGWSVIPETRPDRKPAAQIVWHKGKISRVQVKPSERRDIRIPDRNLLIDLKGTEGNNLAVVNGPASGHARCIDIDCLDEDHARAVTEVALRIFGETPFRRVGRAPKIMLVYRMAGEDINLPTRSVAFLGANGKPDLIQKDGSWVARNAVEFLGAAHNWTCYGLHHSTGLSFDWSQGSLHPAIGGPEHAPLITRKMLSAFYRAINDLRPLAGFGTSSSSSPIGGQSEVSKFHLITNGGDQRCWFPDISRGEWQRDGEGYVIDGREKYLSAMCWAMMSANADLMRTAGGTKLLLTSYKQHCETQLLHDGKWNSAKIARECKSKFEFALPKWQESIRNFNATGRYAVKATPIRLRPDGTALIAQHVTGTPRPDDGSLDWLPEQAGPIPELTSTKKTRAITKVVKTAEQKAADAAARALIPTLEEREAHHIRVAAEVDAGIAAFFEDVARAAVGGIEGDVPVHLLKAPTGAGKSTRTISYIKDMVASIKAMGARQPGEGQIFILLPSHDNIDEGLLTASREGMHVPTESEFDEDDAIAQLAEIGVFAERFMGKKRSKCQRTAEMELLTSKGIGASGLCGAEVEEEEDELVKKMMKARGEKIEKVEILCPFRARGECEYWKQMPRVAAADVVFLPHAYLTMMSLPKVIKGARAVVIDESFIYQVLHQSRMDLDILTTPRKQPFITKKERALYPDRTADDIGTTMLAQRDEVAGIAHDAIRADECPAAAIRDAGKSALVPTALTVVKRSHSDEREITPEVNMEDILSLTTRPKGEALIEEERFWKIIEDRITALDDGTATGDREERLQLVYVLKDGKHKPHVRLSWRSKPNWENVPKLLLDASANERVIAKVFGVVPVVHDVQAPLNLRTILIADRPFANRAFIPDGEATRAEQEVALETLNKTRAMVTKVSGAYSYGRVLMGSTIAVREAIGQGAWAPPENVDPVHYGALRGLDGFKNHSVAISVGRSEQPIHIVDGYKAALTYDDPEPERPFDALGTGLKANGKPLFREGYVRRIKMRTGDDYEIEVPMMRGTWGQIIETSWREEELRQFVGRLRPVYAGGKVAPGQNAEVPVWICQSKVLPEDFAVDEIFSLDDMSADAEFYDTLRLAEGVLADGITDRLPGCGHLAGERLGAWAKRVLPDVPKLGERLVTSMHRVRYRIAGSDQVHIARIAAWHDDPVAALHAAAKVAKVTITEVMDVEMSARTRVTAAKPRAHDKIDAKLAEIAPFRDPRILLQDREEKLKAAYSRIEAAGARGMSIELLESRWRNGEILEDIVDIYTAEFERSQWVRVFDGEEIYEIEPHYMLAA